MSIVKTLPALASIACLGIFAGCNSDEATPLNIFTAEVDGHEFKADEVEGYAYDSEVEIFGYRDDEEEGFMVYFNSDAINEDVTYDLNTGDVVIEYFSDDNYYSPTQGTVHVTKSTNSAFEATFEFVSDLSGREIEITNGVIEVTLERHD